MKIEYLWVEKYRPVTIGACVLPESIKKSLTEFVDSGNIPNLLFSGSAGTGKTSAAIALCKQLNVDYLLINTSLEGNIDTLRNRIAQFASTTSLLGQTSRKIVILDEADYSNSTSFQPSLRGFMENFSKNCGFILTCNFKNRLIEPLQSRCINIEFKFNKSEIKKVKFDFLKSIKYMLEQESVKYSVQTLAVLINKYFPDFRRTINEIQRYSASGIIDSGILTNLDDESFSELLLNLKNKDFTKTRKWVENNSDTSVNEILKNIYDKMYSVVEPQSIPILVLLINQCQINDVIVVDKPLNLMATFVEIMSDITFK